MKAKRIFLIVLDSFGIGELPDAAEYGDTGADTLRSVAAAGVSLPNLQRLGLGNIDSVQAIPAVKAPRGAYARMTEVSNGKDTIIGHWEMAGVVSKRPMPVYPQGFPRAVIEEFSRRTGRGVLCNRPYSGTDVIRDYGSEHLRTGDVIVYTSADSVFQIAAHEEKIPLEQLYEICKIARALLCGENAVARVIARPFTGEYPHFVRTPNRHDFALAPPKHTMLDHLSAAGLDVVAVGKISDIFAARGVTEKILTRGNTDGLTKLTGLLEREFRGLCFVNLVDFDSLYGHRNDASGYARALEEFDVWLGKGLNALTSGDILMVTADHGCDPGNASTDHTREYTPLLVAGEGIEPVNLKTRGSFADIAATVLELFCVSGDTDGESFAKIMIKGETKR